MSPEEREKKERRKEQNRRAAKKCREKKRAVQFTFAEVSHPSCSGGEHSSPSRFTHYTLDTIYYTLDTIHYILDTH